MGKARMPVYRDVARFSARSEASALATDLASISEMTDKFSRILKAVSGFSILRQLDLSLPPMENVSQESFRSARKCTSLWKNIP